jgi:hypothetical protein
MVGQEMKNV